MIPRCYLLAGLFMFAPVPCLTAPVPGMPSPLESAAISKVTGRVFVTRPSREVYVVTPDGHHPLIVPGSRITVRSGGAEVSIRDIRISLRRKQEIMLDINPGDGTVFLAVSHRQPGNITVRFAQTVLAMSAGATASLVPGEPHGLCLRRSQGKVTVQQPRHPTAGGNRNTVDKQHAVTRHQPVPPRRTADRYRRTFIDKD
jgi:hypothetical protein